MIKAPTWLIEKMTAAINAYLHLDEASSSRLQPLIGKTITIELLPLHYLFQCTFTANGVHLTQGNDQPAAAHLSGTPIQMTSLLFAKENRQRFFAEDITLTGDALFGQQVVQLFDALEIDWEEQLAQLIGDVPAYHLGRTFNALSEKIKHAKTSFNENINDYLHEEADWFPTREALQDYFQAVDNLRMDVDRLSARIALIAHSLSDKGDQ